MSYYIALYPSEESIEKLENLQDVVGKFCKGEQTFHGRSKLHLTLRFLREEQLNCKDICRKLLSSVPIQQSEIDIKSDCLDLFGDCLVLRTELTNKLKYTQYNVDYILTKELGLSRSDYDVFNPHISLCKNSGIKNKELPKIKFDHINLKFDQIKLIEKKDSEHIIRFSRYLFDEEK